jgi:hypothetical protein
MAASFPNAKKTFTQVVNGITKLVASLFNAPYDEIEAIETAFGGMGCTSQSYTDSLKNLLLEYQKSCEIYRSGDAEIKVKVGKIAISDASNNVRWRRNIAEVTVNWDNLDTGAEENSTIYYIYAVADSAATTFTIKISKNATTPTGCTFYKKIGSFYNNASGNIERVASADIAIIDSATLVANTPQTLAHGLGAMPSVIQASLVCISAEYGYSVNDEVHTWLGHSYGDGLCVSVDATNVTFIMAANVYILQKVAGSATFITLSKWILRTRCRL